MTTLRAEAIAGITTFFTMSYIVVVNPAILAAPGTGMPFSGALTATVLLSFAMTLAMGLYADLPYAVAPGMGLNAFFTYSLVLGRGIPWPKALGIVFWSGALFLLVSATPLRERIALAMPQSIRRAAAAGIGLLLTFIGLKNAGLVVADPVTFVRLGELGARSLLALGGLALICALHQRRNPLAFLVGVGAATAAGGALGLVRLPERWVSAPDFGSVFLKADLLGALEPAMVPAMVAMMFTDLFDSLSTFVGLSQSAGLLDSRGQPRNLRQGLIVDAFATLGAGLAGTSAGTAYIESSAGIEAGGRTGRTAVATALCFLPCFFLAPLAGMVPGFATAPVLILVGAFMFRSVTGMDLRRLEDALPAFLAMVLIPLTYSITQGLLWGFLSHAALYALAGRRREVEPVQWGLAAASAGMLWLENGGR